MTGCYGPNPEPSIHQQYLHVDGYAMHLKEKALATKKGRGVYSHNLSTRRLWQEDHESRVSLHGIERCCNKSQNKTNIEQKTIQMSEDA